MISTIDIVSMWIIKKGQYNFYLSLVIAYCCHCSIYNRQYAEDTARDDDGRGVLRQHAMALTEYHVHRHDVLFYSDTSILK